MTRTHKTSRWSLQELLPEGPEQLDGLLDQIESCVREVELYRDRLSNDLAASEFLTLLHKTELLRELTGQVGGYAYLGFAEDTQNPTALSLRDRIEQVLTGVQNRTLFFSLWFKSLSNEVADKFIAAAGELSYHLISIRRFKPYTLTEPEEKIINLKDANGGEALTKIYEILTNGFIFNLEVDGEVKQLTRDGLSQYYHHPSPQVRAATYNELYRVYGGSKAVISQIYFSLVRDWGSEAVELRGYPSPISVRNFGNNIPDPVVDALLEACQKNTLLFQRYFNLKARLLKMDKLRRYDIYAPIASSEKTIEFGTAVPLVLDCFNQFSPQIAQAASQVLEKSHLDSQVRPGKRAGAFSYGVSPKYIPWVLVNYNNCIRDVTTLAHELGHSVHSILASHHSVFNFHAPLPLAETASVFAEMLVTDRLLQGEPDPIIKRDLLLTFLDDAYATVERQAYISIFERQAHQRILAGCTSDELAGLYLKNLQEQFGDALELSDEFAWEWLTIPHIFNSPFYPYAYSFGQLLVLALYQQYLADPGNFVPRYIRLLSYGGSAEPQKMLEEAGMDITSPIFWQGGFDILQDKFEQLEMITGGDQ
ncbi:MAG: oligoendopeptidase F [Anaerolineales bacterium]|nr:M3 family oligoendopeptidase [Anaerolineae bacterium]PWB56852.1 MAG: oligoendopeptidase F [Anaerolineales bacterium]